MKAAQRLAANLTKGSKIQKSKYEVRFGHQTFLEGHQKLTEAPRTLYDGNGHTLKIRQSQDLLNKSNKSILYFAFFKKA